jgi:hypothetical protein
MKRFIDLLTPLGLLVVAGAAIAVRRGLALPGGLRPWLVGGFALVVLHLVLRWEDVYRTIGRRQLRYGTNTAVMVLLVLGILGAVNWMANRRSFKKDLTKNQRYSLSDQTRKVVQGLKDEVRLVYFQRGSEMQGAGVDRVRDFGALSPNLKVEFVDPMVKPTRARELGVQSVPTVVVERGDKRERVTTESEQDLTNAILKVTREANVWCASSRVKARRTSTTRATPASGAPRPRSRATSTRRRRCCSPASGRCPRTARSWSWPGRRRTSCPR